MKKISYLTVHVQRCQSTNPPQLCMALGKMQHHFILHASIKLQRLMKLTYQRARSFLIQRTATRFPDASILKRSYLCNATFCQHFKSETYILS